VANISAINLSYNASASTDIGNYSVVVVTITTTIDPTSTVYQTVDSQASTTDNDIDTVTATATSTLTIPPPVASKLPPITLSEIFPGCANITQNISALANITISDIVLPSKLLLSQVLGFFGGVVDCSELLTLLGVSDNSSDLARRDIFHRKRILR
jgi:hypothetical protein